MCPFSSLAARRGEAVAAEGAAAASAAEPGPVADRHRTCSLEASLNNG